MAEPLPVRGENPPNIIGMPNPFANTGGNVPQPLIEPDIGATNTQNENQEEDEEHDDYYDNQPSTPEKFAGAGTRLGGDDGAKNEEEKLNKKENEENAKEARLKWLEKLSKK